MSIEAHEQRMRQALAVFRELLDLEPAARADAVNRRCGDDAALRREVERLCALDQHDAAIDRGAVAMLPTTQVDPRLGQRVGAFRLDAVLGEGGMGTVFRATRIEGGFEQQVALKLIRGGFDGAAARQRFERERAILARLDHPDLAPLIDGGVSAEGAPWYAMPLIDGLPVTHWCDAQRVPLRARIALAARLCDAVQVAHQALVVHRDLKPSNILVDARGAPHLLDFGIAKLLDEADEATHTAARLMTPAYAAPEQIRGEAVSTATDVFALGVILYELACGRHPFGDEENSAFALQRAVVESEPRRLSAAVGENTARATERALLRQTVPARLRRELRGDLTRIVEKALAKSPAQRYVSAAALGDDLRRWLQGETVQATPPSFGYRARKFLGRWRWSLAGAALVLVALVSATAISLRQANVARLAQGVAEANAQSALAAQRFMENAFLAAEPWQNEGTPPNAVQLADRAFESIERDLADQPLASADLYFALSRLYVTAGERRRAVESGERAAALYDTLPVSPARRFEARLRLAYAYRVAGRLDRCERAIRQALAVPGVGPAERAWADALYAELHRERGRYDLSMPMLMRAIAAQEQGSSLWYETVYALADAARMRRHHSDAAREFVRHFRLQGSRGLRTLVAMQALSELPEAQRRVDDLRFAADLERERAVVWRDGAWRERVAGLRAALHLQRGDLTGAYAVARSLEPLAAGEGESYDAEFRLVTAYARLAGGEREVAAQEFERIADFLNPISDPLDARPVLAQVGSACARGEPLSAALRAALAAPPQPDYLGYAWLRIAPCPELRDSAAARHPDPQPYAHGHELRAALDAVAARMGECQSGARVAVGAACPP